MDWDNLSDTQREPYIEKAIDILDGLLFCTRRWDAWGDGTMSQSDFESASDDDDIVDDTARMIFMFCTKEQ